MRESIALSLSSLSGAILAMKCDARRAIDRYHDFRYPVKRRNRYGGVRVVLSHPFKFTPSPS